MPGNDGLRILGDFWKKAVSWDLGLDEEGWFLNWGQSSPVDYRMPTRYWVRWKSQHSKDCVSLFPRVENLKVKKVIKFSYLNYRVSSVFQVFFGFLCPMNVLHIFIFHIFISWSYFGGDITLANLFKRAQVSLGVSFIWPCVKSKQTSSVNICYSGTDKTKE